MKLHPISAAAAGALALSLQGCVTPIVVTVKDDLGRPVSGLKLKAETDNAQFRYTQVMRGLAGKDEQVYMVTDKEGVARGVFTGYVEYRDGGKLLPKLPKVYLRVEDDSRYWRLSVLPTRESGLPLSPMRAKMTVRRKLKPQLMYSGEMDFWTYDKTLDQLAIFLQKADLGYDMVYGDFLPPLGEGKHGDLLLNAEILPNEKYTGEELAHWYMVESRQPDPGPKPAPRPPFTVRYTFRFAGEGNGVVPVPMPPPEDNIGSLIKGYLDQRPGYEGNIADVIPQEAPESGYQSVIIRHREFIPKAEKDPSFTTPERLAKRSWWRMNNGKHDIRDDAVYLFRIRGEKDSKTAHYGVIKSDFCIRRGGGAYLQYIINPTPGERDVEESLDDRARWRKLPLKKKDAD